MPPVSEETLWYNYDVSNRKDWITLINHLQKVCRTSLEYDFWQKTCKLYDSDVCPVCDENYYDNNIKCESHHHPKKLSTIIEEILEKHIEDNVLDEKTGLEIVEEIMGLHTMGQVHYINICEHCHKKFHKDHPTVKEKVYEIFEKRAQEGKKLWEQDQQTKVEIEQQTKVEVEVESKIEETTIVNYETAQGFEQVYIDIDI